MEKSEDKRILKNDEWKALLMVAAIVAAAELTFFFLQDSVSKNLAHIRSIPSIAEKVSKADGTGVLLLGNSYTRRDIRMDVLEEELKNAGVDGVLAKKVYPDSTTAIDWYYLYRNYFVEEGMVPDVVVVGFSVMDHLSDTRPVNPRFLAVRFCGFSDVSELLKYDVRNYEDRVELFISFVSGLFSNQEHIKRRVLAKVIPYYRSSLQHVNRVLNEKGRREKRDDVFAERVSFSRLERFIGLLKQSGARVVFSAIPSVTYQEFDENAVRMLDNAGIGIIDCRNVGGIGPGQYVDYYYLNEAGGTLYTRCFAGKLAEFLKESES